MRSHAFIASRQGTPIPGSVCLLLAVLLLLSACSAKSPLSAQAGRGLDPAGFSQRAVDSRWDIAAVAYEYGGEGFNYTRAKVMPVLLVFKNRGQSQPQVILEDVRGVGASDEFFPYTPDEAVRVAVAAQSTRYAVVSAAQSGAVGAVVGAGLGALVGYVVGKDTTALWQGAVVGAGAGATVGVVAGMNRSTSDLREAVRAEVESLAWQENPVSGGVTRAGYLYLPGNQGIRSVRIVVRDESGDTAYTLNVVSAKEYNPNPVKAEPAPTAAGSCPAPAKPSDVPAPKKAPQQQVI